MLPEDSAHASQRLHLITLPTVGLLAILGLSVALIVSAVVVLSIFRVNQSQVSSAYATQCSVATAKAENYVAVWKLYGTPTPTVTATPRSTYGAIPVTATATYLAARDATRVAVLGATLTPSPTPTLYAMVVGNARRGKALFEGKANCYACHAVDSGEAALVGPSLAHIAVQGGSRVPGLSLEAYLRESIVKPDAYIVPGYAAGIMPRDYEQLLAPQDVDDLIAYMLLK